jgi:hypothetical protein
VCEVKVIQNTSFHELKIGLGNDITVRMYSETILNINWHLKLYSYLLIAMNYVSF